MRMQLDAPNAPTQPEDISLTYLEAMDAELTNIAMYLNKVLRFDK